MSDNPLSADNASSIVSRAKGIITDPKAEWPKIAAETKSVQDIFLTYALPLMLIGPICTLIGMQAFGINAVLFTIRPSLTFSITQAITSLVMSVISLFAVSYIANFVSQQMGGKNDFTSAFKLVAYSFTVAWVLGVLGLITPLVPILGILGLLALYAIYLLYLGATPLMGVQEDKAAMYVAVVIIAAIVLMVITGAITARIVGNPVMDLAASM